MGAEVGALFEGVIDLVDALVVGFLDQPLAVHFQVAVPVDSSAVG